MNITKTSGDPLSGKEVADILFRIIDDTCQASNYTLHPGCYVEFLSGDDGAGDNETSFGECLKTGTWSKAEAQLKYTAKRHGLWRSNFSRKSTRVPKSAFTPSQPLDTSRERSAT